MNLKALFFRIEEIFDRKAERFTERFPFLAFLVMFIGIPVLILMTVSLGTMIFTFPIALVMRWY